MCNVYVSLCNVSLRSPSDDSHGKKNLPAIWEARVPSLGWEDLLEKGMPTHSIILAWRIPWTEKPGELHSLVKVCRVKMMPNVSV